MTQITQSIMYTITGKQAQLCSVKHTLRDIGDNELMVKVSAAGLNRADLLQRQGIYKVPSGDTEVPGVEISGTVIRTGVSVKNRQVGDRVCGVVNGGGFSEYCILDNGMAINVPDGWSDIEAAAFPEAALTANEALLHLGQVKSKERIVIHAATSGMGTMLIKMAKALGSTVICTTTHHEKVKALQELGADHVIVGKGPAFFDSVLEITDGAGADALIDFLAGNFFNSNIIALKAGGRLIMAGILDGHESKANWIPVINKRISILPLTLRMKPHSEKQAVTKRFLEKWWNGTTYAPLHPIIHSVFPLTDLDDAQQAMQANRHIGKIVVLISGEST